jgi:alpha-glucosidase (family GH31 glycosyl hydrolase)
MQSSLASEILSGGSFDTRILRLSPQTLRITHKPKSLVNFPHERAWLGDVLIGKHLADRQKNLKVSLQEDLLQVTNNSGRIVFQEMHKPAFHSDGRVALTFRLTPGEGLYGFGEWFNAFRRTTGRLTLAIRDSPAVLQYKRTYSTLPVFLSDHNYAVFVLNSHRAEVTLDPKHGQLELKFDGPPADYLLISAENPKEILSEYTRLTGRPPLVPLWAYGLWVTSYPQESQAKVLEMVAEHRARQVPLDGVILDYHWEERFHNFKWRKSLFPNPDELIAKLRALRIHLGLIFTPFVNHTNLALQKAGMNLLFKNLPDGVEQEDERDLIGYKEGRAKGYFADDDASWWFGKGGMLDFTNPEAASWWNEKLKPLYKSGVSFFKNDDGEYLPLRAKSATGMDGHEYHNLYGFYYSRAIYEGMHELDQRRSLVYARSAWAGSQRFPAIFLGDQVPSFENLRWTLRAGLNMSLLGFAYWTADVFGLSGRTTPETHMRYAQWALFNPIARYFWRPEKIDKTRKPWSHNEQVFQSFKKHVELRYRLLPYYHQLGWEAWQTGIPHMRPMFLEFPEDVRFKTVYDQVMLGSALMLCPITQSLARSRQVIFPAGEWYNFWTDEKIVGGWTVTVDAPVDRLPLFVRGGSILPMGPIMQFIPDDHRFDQLELHFYPPFAGSTTFIDADPKMRAYSQGVYAETKISISSKGKNIKVIIDKPVVKARLVPSNRKLQLVFHDCEPAQQSTINHQKVEQWDYDPQSRRITVKSECTFSRG